MLFTRMSLLVGPKEEVDHSVMEKPKEGNNQVIYAVTPGNERVRVTLSLLEDEMSGNDEIRCVDCAGCSWPHSRR